MMYPFLASRFTFIIIFAVAEIPFKVASAVDISFLVAKIIFVVSEIIIKEDVMTS